MNKLNELSRINPHAIADQDRYWALYATSFYENLFAKVKDPGKLKFLYRSILLSPKLDGRDKKALTFFYRIRRDELVDPHFWDKVQGKFNDENKNNSMKAKLVKESLDEYNNAFGPMAGSGNEDRSSRELVDKVSSIEQYIWNNGNRVQTMEWDDFTGNMLYGDVRDFDTDDEEQTERFWDDLDDSELEEAIERGEHIINSIKNSGAVRESRLNESVSRYCNFYKAKDGKWYMELADNEHDEYEDATTYGPFHTKDSADEYLDDNFSNPGGAWVDDSGEQEVPTKSPNGKKVVNPRSNGNYMGGKLDFDTMRSLGFR